MEAPACKIGRVATGSPQPPPGGGLLLYVASPSARLRGCRKQNRSHRNWQGEAAARNRWTNGSRMEPSRAAVWGSRGPQFVAELGVHPASCSPEIYPPLFREERDRTENQT